MDEVHNEPVHSRMKPSKAARVEFNDRLIAEVQKRPVLWDCCRPGYKHQRKKMTAWEEVAAECGHDPDAPRAPEAATPEVDVLATLGGSVAKRIPRKVGKKSKADVEIDSLQQLLKKEEDEEAVFGQVGAHKLRSFSKRMRRTLPIEILEVFSKHTCD
ncbi:hypothetical protein HPB49_013875 [Dermacentor silvarum]|uniref:Uncharacterized protein n=1 Tax=Dermacentor silvarum TaxID=543639 RepID=A0ACB8DDP4_DERSI|nr:hypothetical protein HPB49_013875 [Dermacentor silvarum]